MNKLISKKLFFIISLCCASNIFPDKPLLGLVMIVKNEARSMEKIILSIKPFLDRWTILDTGSTDGTQEIIRKTFDGVPGELHEEPFVNFEVSRNRVLDLAGESSTFVLTLNGDETVVNGKALREFCQAHVNDKEGSYLVLRDDPSHLTFGCRGLIRTAKQPRFRGRTHEYLDDNSVVWVPNVSIFHAPHYGENRKKQQSRWQEDLKWFLEEYEKDPKNLRTLFYLAQTYDCLEDWENAAKFYKQRADIQGWVEEDFMTYYRLGQVIERWTAHDGVDRWAQALEYYLKAFAKRPTRIEPLLKVAWHYISTNDYALAYLFARRACEIPLPEREILFVEKNMYDYERHDLLGQAAWYAGEYAVGEQALHKALAVRPDMPHLHRNLAFYLERKLRYQPETLG